MDDNVEKRGSTVSQILKGMLCSYIAVFKLMAVKPVKETNNCFAA
jgi:hypothetical protein